MQKTLLKNISLINEGKITVSDVLIKNERIERIAPQIDETSAVKEIDGTGKLLFPGVIDDQVHFRQPGLTHKANIASEAAAAVAGGVTSFMDMPNTIPNTLTHQLLEEKYTLAANSSVANYSFYMGVSNDNSDEVLKISQHKEDICGIKIFMGSSTGNMLVNNPQTLERLFSESDMLIATHCEDETRIRQNYERLKAEKSVLIPEDHPLIRDDEACYLSSLYAVQMASKFNTRLHILHISAEKELALFGNFLPLKDKRITTEVCVHHLHFTADDYAAYGYGIKCNPSIKTANNKEALWKALSENKLDVIATDHAPHLWSEKQPPYEQAHAGLPLVQHSLLLMLQYQREGRITYEQIAEKMSHAVATCFNIQERGYIREGYYADLVIVNPDKNYRVTKDNLLYKCGWSPLENHTFPAVVEQTFVNGNSVYENGQINASHLGKRLKFFG